MAVNAPSPSSSRRSWRTWAGIGFVGLAILSFVLSTFVIDWNNVVLPQVRDNTAEIQRWVGTNPVSASAVYFLAYVLFTGLSLPGAVVLTLIGGAVFGFWWGVLLTSFASTSGATLAFLASRYLFRERIQAKYGERLERLNRELEREGVWYLLALRLNPVVPFFLINLLFGLTRMSVWRFWWVSQLGMLPATIIYTNAGSQLADIQSISDILSRDVLLSLVALSLFPLLARVVAGWMRKKPAG